MIIPGLCNLLKNKEELLRNLMVIIKTKYFTNNIAYPIFVYIET